MKKRRSYLKITMLVSLTLILTYVVQDPPSAWASMEDAAIFYEELDQHGEWVEYGNHGPVWYPTQVQENWRPYVDGRWTPAEEGYVFETQEPWGWATYHYGNWMPTEEYGWVWVPGRTWYPNTVTWRTSAESASPNESYIGWAPIPPPDYTPQPGYYPEGYYGGAPYRGPLENLVTAPFWIFVKAASFLLGFSQSYAPTYSYWGCNCLVPPPVVPYYYNRTVVVHNYYTPNYYPRGILGAGRGYYNWGPPLPYVSRVTRIKQVTINNYMRRVHVYQRRNVAPPPGLMARRSYFRQVVPPALVKHHAFPRGVRVRDVQAARGNLARPHLVNAKVIKGAPHIPGTIPKTRMTKGKSGQWHRGVPGAALPASAMMRSNQQMKNHLKKIPSSQRIDPVSPRARKWQAPQTPGAAAGQPAALHQRRGPQPTPGKAVAPSAATPRTAPPGMRQGTQGPHKTATHTDRGAHQKMQGQRQKTPSTKGVAPKASPSAQAGVPQQRAKSGKQPQQGKPQQGTWTRRKATPQAGVAQGQPAGQAHRARSTPGTPKSPTATPVRAQTPRRSPTPPRQQPQKQQQKRQQQKKYTPGQPQSYGRGGPQMTGVQPRQRQIQPKASRQVRQQPTRQTRPQIRQQPRPQSQRQVRQQPRRQPQRQVRQRTPSQPQRQVKQQPRQQAQRQVRRQSRSQPRPQAKQRSQAKQQKHRNPKNQQQN
jgi:hypothetical protein